MTTTGGGDMSIQTEFLTDSQLAVPEMSGKRRTKQTKNQPILSRPPVQSQCGVLIADWQRLPRQLLHEQVQKDRLLARPVYSRAQSNEGVRARVVIPHVKSQERSLTFVTRETYENLDLAMEFAALLALFHIVGPLAYERKLPEPFRTAWLSMNTDAPLVMSSATHHSLHDKNQAASQVKHSTNRKAARAHFSDSQKTTVIMSREHRQMVELVCDPVADSSSSTISSLTESILETLRTVLHRDGFAKNDVSDVINAATFAPDMDIKAARRCAIDWLVSNVSEQRLPTMFRSNDTVLNVVVRGKIGAEENISIADRLRRLGYPALACQQSSELFQDYYKARLWLWQEMVQFLLPDREMDQVPPEACSEEIDAEMVALGAIYEQDFQQGVNEEGIWWRVVVSDHNVTLHVEVCPGLDYPNQVPFLDLIAPQLSVHERMTLLQCMIKNVPPSGSCITHELVDWLRANLQSTLMSARQSWPEQWLLQIVAEVKFSTPKTRLPSSETSMQNNHTVNQQLLCDLKARRSRPDYISIDVTRRKLPVTSARSDILSAIDKNPIVIICAETGSGKSTQIPAFIFDHCVERGVGSQCHVVCTQPRRISALGLADRVSVEHCEKVGSLVGYRVRLDSKISAKTHIEYVTNGVLLRRMMTDGRLCGVSHIIIDEVHERSVEIDLLLLGLRRLMLTGQRPRIDLKLILMSATAQTSLLCPYFTNCPILAVPGRTFPVQLLYAEDIVESSGYVPQARFCKPKGGSELDIFSQPNVASSFSEATMRVVSRLNFDVLNADFLTIAIWHILENFSDTGGILCFLPGAAEISSSIRNFQRSLSSHDADPNLFILLALHGSLSSSEQSRVFVEAPSGSRKIVFATNVAETSITVNDIAYVIDTGLMKQNRFDPQRNVSTLANTFIARSNAEQRMGRAGRVRSGWCLRLFSHSRFASMPLEHRPELHRISLQGVCLQLRRLLPSEVLLPDAFLLAIDPPDPVTVAHAIESLKAKGALDASTGQLTALGHHLSLLPVDVHLGKMLILSACFDCVTPIVCLAALLSIPSPFLGGDQHRETVARVRLQYAGNSESDYLTLLNLFNAWLRVRHHHASDRDFCNENCLSRVALQTAFELARSYVESLVAAGFISRVKRSDPDPHAILCISEHHNRNSSSSSLLRAVIGAGLYPNVLRVQRPEKRFTQVSGGVVAATNQNASLRYYRYDGARVHIHNSSVNATKPTLSSSWLVFHKCRESSTASLLAFDTSVVSPYTLLMFGGDLDVDASTSIIRIDRWITFHVPGRVGILVRNLRLQLDSLLLEKSKNPSMDVAAHQVALAIVKLLVSGGDVCSL